MWIICCSVCFSCTVVSCPLITFNHIRHNLRNVIFPMKNGPWMSFHDDFKFPFKWEHFYFSNTLHLLHESVFHLFFSPISISSFLCAVAELANLSQLVTDYMQNPHYSLCCVFKLTDYSRWASAFAIYMFRWMHIIEMYLHIIEMYLCTT